MRVDEPKRVVSHIVNKVDPSAVEKVGDTPVEDLEGKSSDLLRAPEGQHGDAIGAGGGKANSPSCLLLSIAVEFSGCFATPSDQLPP